MSVSTFYDKLDPSGTSNTDEKSEDTDERPQFLRHETEYQDVYSAHDEQSTEEMIASNSDRNVKLVEASAIVFSVAFLLFSKTEALHTRMAQILVVPFLSFFIHVFWVLFGAKSLHRIRVYNRRLKNFAPISVPFRVVGYKKYPIESVSEMCCARGSLLSKNLLIMLSSFQVSAFVYTYYCSIGTMEGMLIPHRVLHLIGGIGAGIVGLIEYDMLDMAHVGLHMFGFALNFCGVLALCISRRWDIVSIIWLTFDLCFLASYVASLVLVARKSYDLRVVTRRSRIILTIEMIYAIISLSAMIRYMSDGIDCGTF